MIIADLPTLPEDFLTYFEEQLKVQLPNIDLIFTTFLNYQAFPFTSTDYSLQARSYFKEKCNVETSPVCKEKITHSYLKLPSGDGPFPCAILCHGSEGVAYHSDNISFFTNQGIATLTIDRLWGEGVTDTLEDQTRLSLQTELIITFSAIKELFKNKRIDRNKIGFVGESRGALVALECTLQHNIDALFSDFKPAFCVSYYPMILIQKKARPQAPTLFIFGANDDMTPLSCFVNYFNYTYDQEKTTETIHGTSIDGTRVIVYPDAGHSFNGPISSITTNPTFMNLSDCCVRETEDGLGFQCLETENIYPWENFPIYLGQRIKLGATIETNPEAGRDAQEQMISFVKGCL